MPIRKVPVGKKFPINSCLPDFPVNSCTVYQGEIRKTGIYEKKCNQTGTFPIATNFSVPIPQSPWYNSVSLPYRFWTSMKLILLSFFTFMLTHCRHGNADSIANVKLLAAEPTFENPAVGYLAHNSSAEKSYCTATLVAPHVVLTAAHCSLDASRGGYFEGAVEGELVFVVQRSKTESFKYRVNRAKSFAVDLGSDSDFALLSLYRSVPVDVAKPAGLAATRPQQGTPSKWFGYGCTGHAINPETNKVVGTGESGNKLMINQTVGAHRYQGCPGDSGGPTINSSTGEIYDITSEQRVTDDAGQPLTDEYRRTHFRGKDGDWGEFTNVAAHYKELISGIAEFSAPKEPRGVELLLVQLPLRLYESPITSAAKIPINNSSMAVITGMKKFQADGEDWWQVIVVTRGSDTHEGFMQANYLKDL
jgi:hypothetical protein